MHVVDGTIMRPTIFNASVERLATLLEEGARANVRMATRFIEPAEGTLRRATTKRHHIIFGRRGSGKSSLLFKSADTLSTEGRPIAYVDLEPYKGHHYPDLLISVLLGALKAFRKWLDEKEIPGESSRRWHTAFLLKSRTTKGDEKRALLSCLDAEISDLMTQLHAADGATMVAKHSGSEKAAQSSGSTAKAGVDVAKAANFGSQVEMAASTESNLTRELQEEYKRSK